MKYLTIFLYGVNLLLLGVAGAIYFEVLEAKQLLGWVLPLIPLIPLLILSFITSFICAMFSYIKNVDISFLQALKLNFFEVTLHLIFIVIMIIPHNIILHNVIPYKYMPHSNFLYFLVTVGYFGGFITLFYKTSENSLELAIMAGLRSFFLKTLSLVIVTGIVFIWLIFSGQVRLG